MAKKVADKFKMLDPFQSKFTSGLNYFGRRGIKKFISESERAHNTSPYYKKF